MQSLCMAGGRPSSPSRLVSLLGLVSGLPLCVQAQTAALAAADQAVNLDQVVVTANPLGSGLFDLVTPASVLQGDALTLRRGSTVGETVAQMPGVAQSQFGPNASRPIIRGLDGDRIRVMQNSTGMLDASSLSFDHAVAVDPLIVNRVEVVRGAAALLYGGNAVGGVVNLMDGRVPTQRADGPTGAVELRAGGAASERSGAALLDFGTGPWAFHVDAHGLRTDDLRIPGSACTDRAASCPAPGAAGHLPNSDATTDGGAFGAAYVGERGSFGAAYSTLDSTYGTVKELGVAIKLANRRLDWSGEWQGEGWLKTLRVKGGATDYEHEEVDTATGAIGTTFRNRGFETRVEAVHRPLGPFEGAFGLQVAGNRFSALGDEAFVPSTRTRSNAAFLFEEAPVGATVKGNAGVRIESVDIDSAGDAAGEAERFGPATERRFNAVSGALGASWKWGPQWVLAGNLSLSQRAPTFYELFANGPHVATGSFERGDASLDKERARAVDLSLRRTEGHDHFSVDLYLQRFSNYIAELATGETQDVDGEALPVYRFTPVRARVMGFEVQWKHRLLSGPSNLDLEWQASATRADNLTSGTPLPRIPPVRMTTALAYDRGPWNGRLEWVHAASQGRVPAPETPTEGYDLVNLDLGYRLKGERFDTLIYLKAENLGNETARLSTSFLREIAPLGGRSLKLGLRTRF